MSQKRCCDLLLTSQHEFLKHLKECHLTIQENNRHKIFICKYGPDKECRSSDISSQFFSQFDYESHIIRYHLPDFSKQVASGVSRVEVPLTAKTYQIVKDQRYRSQEKCPRPISNCDQSSSHEMTNSSTRWSTFHASVNFSAVLNDPSKKHRQTDIFSRTWGDSFEHAEVPPSPYLVDVELKTFHRYLRRIIPRLKAIQNANSPPTKSPSSAEPQSLQDLECVPKMFFSSNFDLSQSSTFASVLPFLSPNNGNGSRHVAGNLEHDWLRNLSVSQASISNQFELTHNKLSHCLDIIEVLIAKQVSKKSGSFFEAMSSHDAVREQLNSTLQQIRGSREKMSAVNKHFIVRHLRLLVLHRRKRNYEALFKKLKLMLSVHLAHPTLQTLLSSSDFCGALDLISTTQEIVHDELHGLHCLRHLDAQLNEMGSFVGRMIHSEFVQMLHVQLSSAHREPNANSVDEYQLRPYLLGMLRMQDYQFVDMFRNAVGQEVKDIVKSVVLREVARSVSSNAAHEDNNHFSTLDDTRSLTTSQDSSSGAIPSLADQMRRLGFQDWMKLFDDVCHELSAFSRQVKNICDTMRSAVITLAPVNLTENADFSALSHSPVVISKDTAIRLLNEISRIYADVILAIQSRVSKVISIRGKDAFFEKLSSSQFVKLKIIINKFLEDINITNKMESQPMCTLRQQAVRLVSRFHEERKQKLSLILDNERWKQADVPKEFQHLANSLWFNGALAISHATQGFQKTHRPSANAPNDAAIESTSSQALVVGKERFVVVGTVLLLFKMIVEYCQYVEDIEDVTVEILSRLLDLLKVFNSRTCQLVLGAGALQLVGLKTISTKNLALASRCLQLVVFLMPLIRKHFSRHLVASALDPTVAPAAQMTPSEVKVIANIDQVEKLYREHIEELSGKLVSIMDNNIAECLQKWLLKPPIPSQEIRRVCAQINKLNEAVCDVLSEDQILDLFMRIHAKFKSRLRLKFVEMDVKNDNSPQHGLVLSELNFYMDNLRELPGLDAFQDDFRELWQIALSAKRLLQSQTHSLPAANSLASD